MEITLPATRDEILQAAHEGRLTHIADCAEVYDVIEVDMSWMVGDREYTTLDEDDSPTVRLINQLIDEGAIERVGESVAYPESYQTIITYRYSAAEAGRGDGS